MTAGNDGQDVTSKVGQQDTWQWERLSLARQFALAGGTVMLVAILAVGLWVSGRIEDISVHNTARATALYMESFVAPALQDLTAEADLSPDARQEIATLFKDTTLGQRVVSFKLWSRTGEVIEASNEDLVGQEFEPTDNLRLALTGEVTADLEETGDAEDVAEGALGLPLLEIYAPIRNATTGEIVAVAEFYELATELKADLLGARLATWGTVAAVMVAIGISMFAIVLRGSFTIDRQIAELKSLSARNLALRIRAQGAAGRVAALSDSTMKQVGADLHDGPAQLLAFAALRLDALRAQSPLPKAQEEIDAIERALREALTELRSIARGLSLPDIERRSLTDLLQALTRSHSERTGSPVAFSSDVPDGAAMSEAVKTCAYRFAQEGLSNAWKHGGGASQAVHLELSGQMLTIVVSDRGPGFGPEATRKSADTDGGMGLSGLADRVESLGGRIDTGNRPGGGAELRMSLDLRGAE